MKKHDPAWDLFTALQRTPDSQSIDQTIARDEALDAVLDDMSSDHSSDSSIVWKRYYSLCKNRLSKQKNRRVIHRRRSRCTHRRGGTEFGAVILQHPQLSVVTDLAYRQSLDLIRALLTEAEFMMLMKIADGFSYDELARDQKVTLSAIKSKALRIRAKIHNSPAAGVLRYNLRA